MPVTFDSEVRRYRLIVHCVVDGSHMVEGTYVQAYAFAEELSVIWECYVMLTELQDNNIPLILNPAIAAQSVLEAMAAAKRKPRITNTNTTQPQED